MVPMDSQHERLLELVAERRKALGLDRQADLIRASGISRSTMHRFLRGESIDETSLRKISRGLKWAPDSAQDVLAGAEPKIATPDSTDLEGRYQHEVVVNEGQSVATVEDRFYKFFMASAPDTTLEEFDRIRRKVFQIFEEEGIPIARKHDESSPDSTEES